MTLLEFPLTHKSTYKTLQLSFRSLAVVSNSPGTEREWREQITREERRTNKPFTPRFLSADRLGVSTSIIVFLKAAPYMTPPVCAILLKRPEPSEV